MKEVAPRVGQEESQKFSILGLSHDPKGMTATCGNPRHIAHHVPVFFDQHVPYEEFNRWRKTDGLRSLAIFTYFLVGERTNLIKIGKSLDPWRRFAEIRNQTAQDVEIAATICGDLELEYHSHFAQHRAYGEWFYPHEDLICEIDAIRACDPLCTTPPMIRSSSRLARGSVMPDAIPPSPAGDGKPGSAA